MKTIKLISIVFIFFTLLIGIQAAEFANTQNPDNRELIAGGKAVEYTYYFLSFADDTTTGAFKKEYTVMDYGDMPLFIINRKGINIGMFHKILITEYTQMKKEIKQGRIEEVLLVSVKSDQKGQIIGIETYFDYSASTGIIKRTFSFGPDGIVKKISIEADTETNKPVRIRRTPGLLVLIEEFEYFQGGSGEHIINTHMIYLDEDNKIKDYKFDTQREDIYDPEAPWN
ncbi:MAG: hypothetical protein JW969_01260 [Spirochaetales bacterium]|nr:hypothetical protein [Spirochaetales bacterium]